MLKPALLRASCWAMVLLFPAATVLADVSTAMISVAGHVQVNGKRTEKSTSVFAGDRVTIGAESSATLSANGSTLMLGPGSDVTYHGGYIQMNVGSAVILTSKGLGVSAGNLTMKPAAAERTRFEVRNEAGTLQISAIEGSLSVSNGADVVLLEPGKTLSQAANTKAPGMPRATSSVAAGLIIGLLIAAGVATGVALAVRNDEVSGSSP